MKKTVNALAVIIFNLCLIWTVIASSALILASSEDFYKNQLKEVGIYSTTDEYGNVIRKTIHYIGGKSKNTATFSDAQLDIIVEHIIDYLFGDGESFALTLDNVYMLGKGYTNGVSIFGAKAVKHMADVKSLINAVGISLIFTSLALIFLLIYFIKKRLSREASKYSLCFYGALLAFAALFCLWSYIGSSDSNPFLLNLWGNIHYLIFPLQSNKFSGAFFDDTLTFILTTEFFIGAVVIILAVLLLAVSLWLSGALIWKKTANIRLK